jgi:hypothetical protein
MNDLFLPSSDLSVVTEYREMKEHEGAAVRKNTTVARSDDGNKRNRMNRDGSHGSKTMTIGLSVSSSCSTNNNGLGFGSVGGSGLRFFGFS